VVHNGAMRTLLILAALLFAPAANAQSLEDLHWLKGCWRTQGPGPVVTEVWLAPPMPAMIGYAYTVGESETPSWEAMRIEMIDDAPTFVAMPGGGAAVRFRLHAGFGLTDARFDNAQHDYPQTVRYRREGNRLTAVISRLDGSDPMTFAYRRISCASNLRP
jgi:hypothetical protein